MAKIPDVHIKRIYDPPADADGHRVLVDRFWPRGMSKENATVDFWAKDVAPSTELRQWFIHDPSRFAEFRDRYLLELAANGEAVQRLVDAAKGPTITLLYAARDQQHNHAVVLLEHLTSSVSS